MPPSSTRQEDRESGNPLTALRKGAACLQCRKRKMRCDAGQPHCANCVKGKKDCQYAAGRAKTKTQMLREKIQDLEGKIRALEQGASIRHFPLDSPTTSPDQEDAILYDDSELPSPTLASTRVGASRQKSANSHSSSSQGPESPPIGGSRTGSEWALSSDFLVASATAGVEALGTPISSGGPSMSLNWWDADDPPPVIQSFLIDTFLSRPDEFHLCISRERFLASLQLPQPQCPHPALMNAIYLLGCHFTRKEEFTQHEPLYLSRAREALLASLAHSDRLFDFLMASNLVAYYLYRTGRFLEAHHQTAGAARFAVSCGLHQILSPLISDSAIDSPRGVRASAPWSVSDMSVRRPGSMLTPPKDDVELGLRIIVFWLTYLLDKLGSAVTSLPGSLPDEADPLTEIQTVWPRTLEEYEAGDVRTEDYATIRSLYDPSFISSSKRRPETLLGLQAQITALHERASRLSSSFSSATSPQARERFWQTFNLVDAAINRFKDALPPLRNSGHMAEIPAQEDSWINPSIFVIHTLSHLATIQLHTSLVSDIPTSYERCLTSAREILRLALLLRPIDYERMSMEMIHSYAWTTTAQVLIRHLRNLRNQARFEEVNVVNLEVESLIHAMNQMRATYPVVSFQLGKIEEWRRN